ncbi:MAG TPA: BsuBI/PstI family type II restriction endonuclease, partial [Thermoanaerobaculia bacterium]
LDATPPLIVFVECVVTDGPINERRKHELEELALGGGFLPTDCAYVTTFLDRDRSPFKRMAASLAWGTFVWFSTEPEHLVFLRKGGERGMVSVARLLRL